MKILFAMLICFAVARAAQAQGTLPLTILSKPTHVGDTVQKDMVNAKPDATTYQTSFRWSGSGVGELFLIINVSHLVPKERPEFQKGFYQTSVLLNGNDIGILNKLLRGKVEAANSETVAMSFKASLLIQGENTLVIKPGGKDGDLDDMELHTISIDSKRPR
jgi:hypothetical protein